VQVNTTQKAANTNTPTHQHTTTTNLHASCWPHAFLQACPSCFFASCSPRSFVVNFPPNVSGS
jgi:hypothetical protein